MFSTSQSGQSNFTKELKHGAGLERVPCGEPWANAVWGRLGVVACNLVVGFKRLACPAAWARHTIATLRWKLIQVAARIVRHAGQVVLARDRCHRARFRGIRRQCGALCEGP